MIKQLKEIHPKLKYSNDITIQSKNNVMTIQTTIDNVKFQCSFNSDIDQDFLVSMSKTDWNEFYKTIKNLKDISITYDNNKLIVTNEIGIKFEFYVSVEEIEEIKNYSIHEYQPLTIHKNMVELLLSCSSTETAGYTLDIIIYDKETKNFATVDGRKFCTYNQTKPVKEYDKENFVCTYTTSFNIYNQLYNKLKSSEWSFIDYDDRLESLSVLKLVSKTNITYYLESLKTDKFNTPYNLTKIHPPSLNYSFMLDVKETLDIIKHFNGYDREYNVVFKINNNTQIIEIIKVIDYDYDDKKYEYETVFTKNLEYSESLNKLDEYKYLSFNVNYTIELFEHLNKIGYKEIRLDYEDSAKPSAFNSENIIFVMMPTRFAKSVYK